MKYKGCIHKSRTLDALAVYSFLSAMFPILSETLPEVGLTVTHMAIFNITMNGLLWWLRYVTTGPVGG